MGLPRVKDGDSVGYNEGLLVGDADGSIVGLFKKKVGEDVGAAVGADDGDAVGISVGVPCE